jgi:hypothetical protein
MGVSSVPVEAPNGKIERSCRRADPQMGEEGYSRYLHGLPHDGVEPRAGLQTVPFVSLYPALMREQWVNDIADAGGASYTFHIEATSTCRSSPCLHS